jgi:hypothetical protein
MRSMGSAELLHGLIGSPRQLQHNMHALPLVPAALWSTRELVRRKRRARTSRCVCALTLSACSEIPIEAASLTIAMFFLAFMNRFLRSHTTRMGDEGRRLLWSP